MNQDSFNAAAEKAPPPRLSDEALLDLVQKQTLKFFWEGAHPVSGMAYDRDNALAENDHGSEAVTTGGTGFGIMALIAGAERRFLPKADVQARIEKIVTFLEGAETYHGAFAHFINGSTAKTIPFLPNYTPMDNGGDLVETSFLMMGLLAAREYYKVDPAAAPLIDKINKMWEAVEWDWYTKGEDKLYWHWSKNHDFGMNMPVKGWNEALVTYVLAAASPTHPISREAYVNGWTKGEEFKNGETYAGIFIDGKPSDFIKLPLGPPLGGPVFFTHYSFMGLNPHGLKDEHVDYFEQNRAHVLLNRAHVINNPLGHKGYGPDSWGLTASDSHDGYSAHSPANDLGVIAPTAALSSFPYTPEYSMQALRHFYEDLGDKIWGDFGFVDAFNEGKNWYAKSHLAIDQGPIVVMIENYRSGLLWNLFMGAPEIRPALDKLGFDAAAPEKPIAAPKAVKLPKLPSL